MYYYEAADVSVEYYYYTLDREAPEQLRNIER